MKINFQTPEFYAKLQKELDRYATAGEDYKAEVFSDGAFLLLCSELMSYRVAEAYMPADGQGVSRGYSENLKSFYVKVSN